MIKTKINNFLSKYFGYALKKNPLERQAIIEARELFGNKEIIVCEIGVYYGEHALSILKNLNIKKLYLIDPYLRYEEYKNDKSSEDLKQAKINAHKILKNYENKIVWIEEYSDKAINKIKEELDFVYIDGNHFSPYIDNDLRNYYPLVKEGGILSGHDYWGYCFKDVKNAVHNFIKKEDKILDFGYGSDWVIIR